MRRTIKEHATRKCKEDPTFLYLTPPPSNLCAHREKNDYGITKGEGREPGGRGAIVAVPADGEGGGGGADARGRQLSWLCQLTVKEEGLTPGGSTKLIV